MINMDKVPNSNPSAVIKPGTYKLTVTKTEMKQPNDLEKPMYMKIHFKAEGVDGNIDTFDDNFFDSDSSYLMFKLTRFLKALKLNLTGQIELRDIEKLVQKDAVVVGVITNSKSEWQGKEQTNADIDIFNSDCYYPVSEWAKFKGEADDPFNQAQSKQEETTEQNPETEDVSSKY
jgi:hypothetical protein